MYYKQGTVILWVGFFVFPSFKLHSYYKWPSENTDKKGIVKNIVSAPNKGDQSLMYLLFRLG